MYTRPRQPYLDDVGTMFFYLPDPTDYWNATGCLLFDSSTDLRIESPERELLCRSAKGLTHLGLVKYEDYETKCSSVDGTISIPTEEYVNRERFSRQRRFFWTGIKRTGPYSSNFTSSAIVSAEQNCYESGIGGRNFSSDVYATPLNNLTRAPTMPYVFTLRNIRTYGEMASCVCVKWFVISKLDSDKHKFIPSGISSKY